METQKGKSSTKAKNKYNSNNYDNLRIIVPKGRKSEILAVAEAAGDSLNAFVSKAIALYIAEYKHTYTKVYTMIGGVNGVGKSSFIGAQKNNTDFSVVIDVDKMTALNRVFSFEGGKMASQCINECLEDGISFAHETALADNKAESTALKAKEQGYFIRLYYIGLDTAEESLKRISNRVARGGYDIGEVDIRRRFAERWRAVKKILPYCNEAFFFDNDNGFVEVAKYLDSTMVLRGESQPTWILEFSEYLKRNKIRKSNDS